MSVGWFGQKSVVFEEHTKIPSSFGAFIPKDQGPQQALAPGGLKNRKGGHQFHQTAVELFAAIGCMVGQVFVQDNLNRLHGHSASQWIATKGGTVLTGSNAEHDFVRTQDGRNR